LFTVPQKLVMWGAGGAQGPKAAPGMYTAKLSMGSWSETQTFHLGADPRFQPAMTDAEGAQQLKLAQDVGGMIKTTWENLAKIRDAKAQAKASAEKTPAVAAAAKTLTDKLVAVEGDITQLQGEAGEDALNFPGRFDNQLMVLYGAIIGSERKPGTAVTERYADLKPQYDTLVQRANAALTTDVATFNAAATKAGGTTITVK
jgi:hypothetical protein